VCVVCVCGVCVWCVCVVCVSGVCVWYVCVVCVCSVCVWCVCVVCLLCFHRSDHHLVHRVVLRIRLLLHLVRLDLGAEGVRVDRHGRVRQVVFLLRVFERFAVAVDVVAVRALHQ
jgi:hypothetical protein